MQSSLAAKVRPEDEALSVEIEKFLVELVERVAISVQCGFEPQRLASHNTLFRLPGPVAEACGRRRTRLPRLLLFLLLLLLHLGSVVALGVLLVHCVSLE